MSAKNTQLVLLGGALVLFVLLFIAPRTTAEEKPQGFSAAKAPEVSPTANVEVYLNTAVKNLEAGELKKYTAIKDTKTFDSIARFWDSQKRPDLAAWFSESAAKQENSAEAWKKA